MRGVASKLCTYKPIKPEVPARCPQPPVHRRKIQTWTEPIFRALQRTTTDYSDDLVQTGGCNDSRIGSANVVHDSVAAVLEDVFLAWFILILSRHGHFRK